MITSFARAYQQYENGSAYICISGEDVFGSAQDPEVEFKDGMAGQRSSQRQLPGRHQQQQGTLHVSDGLCTKDQVERKQIFPLPNASQR